MFHWKRPCRADVKEGTADDSITVKSNYELHGEEDLDLQTRIYFYLENIKL